MLHLLTDEQRKKVVVEYRKRVVITFLFGVLCVCIIGSVFILPTFFISYGKYAVVLEKSKALDYELAVKEESGSSENIKNVTLSIEALKIFEDSKNPSAILNGIVSAKPNGIKIRNFIFTPGEDAAMTVDLSGTADVRKSLVQFKQGLNDNSAFDDVIIPLSDFAKEKNINFSLKIIVSTSTIDTVINSSSTKNEKQN
ncbi:MAG: hypothetical protein K9M11_04620 [Candidatus Pacebacteria bacterium]|nr:hypothetical protein [Candidatus Paceibacterota bacterium]